MTIYQFPPADGFLISNFISHILETCLASSSPADYFIALETAIEKIRDELMYDLGNTDEFWEKVYYGAIK